jgi:tetratricopeptide (TPR) repeat protein
MVGLLLASLPVQAGDYERRRTYDALFLEAMLQREKGNHDAAFSLLSRCLEIDSTASESYYFLAQYYAEMKQPDLTLAYFKKASQLEPNNTDYMETLAQAYISKEQYADAVTVVERLYERDKSRQDLLEMLYKLHLQVRNFEKAIDVLNLMETIDGKSERLSLSKSGLYLQLGDNERALQEVEALSKQYPNDLNYRTLYANTLMMGASDVGDERNEQARHILEEVLAEEPNNYRAQVSMRTYYLRQEATAQADSLTRSILLNPATTTEDKVALLRQEIGYSEQHGGDSTRVLGLFSEMLAMPEPDADMAEFCAAYMNMKHMPTDSITRMLQLVLQLAPDYASARLQLVQYAWEANDNLRVIELCKAARQYNPEEMAFYYYQGMAYYRQDDRDHALESFQNGISVITDESNPAIVSDFYAVMGDLLHQKGRQREAFAAYDSCLQWKPDNIGCLNNYAYYLSELGQQLDKAETMSRRTITAEPRNGTYLDTYAWILFMQKRYSEARIYIEQAVLNDSTKSDVILEHAGDIFALDGDIEQALNYWQQAYQLNAKNKILARKIKRKKYIK